MTSSLPTLATTIMAIMGTSAAVAGSGLAPEASGTEPPEPLRPGLIGRPLSLPLPPPDVGKAMLTYCVPNKGRLSEDALTFGGASRHQVRAERALMAGLGEDFQALFVRAQDVPEFVADGAADLGITAPTWFGRAAGTSGSSWTWASGSAGWCGGEGRGPRGLRLGSPCGNPHRHLLPPDRPGVLPGGGGPHHPGPRVRCVRDHPPHRGGDGIVDLVSPRAPPSG